MNIRTLKPGLGGWRRTCRGLLALAALLHASAVVAQEPQRHALLVGVGDYLHINDLEGPPHDVAALRDVLQRRWGFRPETIRTLGDGQASRANILGELAALERRSRPGDEPLGYFS